MKKWFSFNQKTQKVEEITASPEAFANLELLYWTRGMEHWVNGAEALTFFTTPVEPVIVPVKPIIEPEPVVENKIKVLEEPAEEILPEVEVIKPKKVKLKKKTISLTKEIRSTPEFILIKKNLKPALFIQIKRNGYKTKLLKIKKLNSNISYFVEGFSKKLLNVVIFNKKCLKNSLRTINLMQKKKIFKSPDQIINLIHNRYSFREKFKNSNKKNKLNYALIEGICFGYPPECAKEFIKEMKSGKIRGDRKVYKVSKEIAFIGYPEFKSICVDLAKKWKKALKVKK